MNEEQSTSTATALTVIQRAALALGTAEHERKLIELAQASTDLIEIRDSASYQQVHGAYMALKRARIDIETAGDNARRDARDFQTAVIAEQRRLVAIVDPEENRLRLLRNAYDEKVAAEKEAKRKAEEERIAKIQSLMAEIREFAITDGTAAAIAASMDALEQFAIDERFCEFKPDAEQLKVATMNRLNRLHEQAETREAEQRAEAERIAAEEARLKAEREELERRQAEQAERERVERERIEAARIQQEGIERAARERRERAESEAREAREREEREARKAREREEAAAKARIEEEERAARQRIEEEERQAREVREAQEAKAKAEFEEQQAKLRAEADRLAKEREAKEKREREAEAKREAKEKAKREKAEAAERAKREAEEAAERERQRQAQERMDACDLACAFVSKFGHLPEWSRTVEAIRADLTGIDPVAAAGLPG